MSEEEQYIIRGSERNTEQWFFKCTNEGEFVWNPKLIEAFVVAVEDSVRKRITKGFDEQEKNTKQFVDEWVKVRTETK